MAAVQKRKNSYRAQVRRKGKSVSATFDTKREAIDWAAQAETKLLQGSSIERIKSAPADPLAFTGAEMLGSSVNTPAIDGCVSLSRDGLSLYYNSNRTGNQDIYVAYRSDKDSGFSNPERLPFPINTGADEFCPTSDHGNLLYFSRASSGDPGDLYVSQEGPRGWNDPEALGDEINPRSWMRQQHFMKMSKATE